MTKSIILTDEEVASMLTRAFHEGFNFSREGFNGECAFDHLAPDGLTLEEKSAITVREILADHDAKLMTKPIILTDKEIETIKEMLHLIETKHEDYGREAHYLRNLLEKNKG
jgi:hypothetical protein